MPQIGIAALGELVVHLDHVVRAVGFGDQIILRHFPHGPGGGVARDLLKIAVHLDDRVVQVQKIPAAVDRNGGTALVALQDVLDKGPDLLAVGIFAEGDVRVFIQHQEKLVSKIGVKLRPGVPADFLLGGFRGEGLAIGAVVDHGVVGIHDTDDSRENRNVRAGELLGIAVSVPALVVGENHRRNGTKLVGGHGDLVALFRVGFQDHPLRGREGAGLVEDFQGDPDFADVMKQAEHLQVGELGIGQTDAPAEGLAHLLGALDMGLGVRVGLLKRADKRADRLGMKGL